ncbi:hypothetical protein EK21DRAFT_80698 [Setomelanomma holmii]|uniref:Uncharacterized protein n=1 Tax=Setomelanomma holmii TaxID=210430 RepID=A0A9P4GXX7_9PLEO|nr:hypothetical protein EK21DRAFT_80698 [Setomelanomma holmii]
MPFLALGLKKRATPASFSLYAYSEGFGGQPLFYADGYAYIGDPAKSNITDAAPVLFSSGSNNMWYGSPNTTFSNGTTPSWSNVTLTVPGPASTDRRVSLPYVDNSTDGTVTSGFIFYGSTAMHVTADGQLESMFYALQVSDRVSALYWNDTSIGQVPVILRNIAPSNPGK